MVRGAPGQSVAWACYVDLSMKKILVIQTGFLGDTILSSAVFSNIKEIYPDSYLTVLTTPGAVDLVKYHIAVDEVIPFAKRGKDRGIAALWAMSRRLSAEKFDFGFCLHKSVRSSILMALSGVEKSYGFSEATLGMFFSSTAARSSYSHDVLRNLAILKNVGFDPEELDTQLSIGLTSEWLAEADSLLGRKDSEEWIGIAPGSVWETKKWRAEGFAELSDRLDAQGKKVVLIGGPDDRDSAEYIESIVGCEVLNLVGVTSLGVSAAVISKLQLLVCNDSGPQHMASALGTPLVAIFCATVPEFGYGPWGVPNEIVEVSDLDCRPCGRHGGNTCPIGTYICREDISSQMVFDAVMRVLELKE